MAGFAGEASVAEIGAALGDTGRVRMLTALLGNAALTAGEKGLADRFALDARALDGPAEMLS